MASARVRPGKKKCCETKGRGKERLLTRWWTCYLVRAHVSCTVKANAVRTDLQTETRRTLSCHNQSRQKTHTQKARKRHRNNVKKHKAKARTSTKNTTRRNQGVWNRHKKYNTHKTDPTGAIKHLKCFPPDFSIVLAIDECTLRLRLRRPPFSSP